MPESGGVKRYIVICDDMAKGSAGIGAAFAALGGNASTFTQLLEGTDALTAVFLNLPVGDGLADTDVHELCLANRIGQS